MKFTLEMLINLLDWQLHCAWVMNECSYMLAWVWREEEYLTLVVWLNTLCKVMMYIFDVKSSWMWNALTCNIKRSSYNFTLTYICLSIHAHNHHPLPIIHCVYVSLQTQLCSRWLPPAQECCETQVIFRSTERNLCYSAQEDGVAQHSESTKKPSC